jgi:hypothetical protein
MRSLGACRATSFSTLDWVEMRVVHVSSEVAIIEDRVLPVSPRLVMTGDCGSPMGNAFANAVLIARHRPGKSASPCGSVHRQCMWSGRTTQASIWKGARPRTCRTASRSVSMRGTSKFDRRSSRFTVSKNVPPGTRLAGLGERRNALRGWARILQGWKNVVRPSRPRFARHLRMRYFS